MPAFAIDLSRPRPAAVADTPPARGFGVYAHWPFCRSKCPYCDFNSHVREAIDEARWQRAYLTELDHAAARTEREPVTSVFFGGGTPSLMPPATVAAILDRVAQRWPLAPDLEVTLEANPTSVEAAKLADFRAAGVNRVSLGVQSLDDAALRFLGRQHSAAEAVAALKAAQKLFNRVSFDLIYARPGQTVAAWRRELETALALAGEHLSLYTLTIEPNTGFAGAVARGEFRPAPDDATAALYDATQELCEAAGLPAYEISNHARPGAACRHNLTYWRAGAYVGIGPGAHGRLVRQGAWRATCNARKPEAWLDAVATQGHGTGDDAAIDARERVTEALMMGLRLAEGVHETNLAAASGVALDDAIDAARLRRLIDGGFLQRKGPWLRATPKGTRVLDSVLGELLA